MRQIIWTHFAVSELKKIFLYHQMIAGKTTATKIRNAVFSSTKKLIKHPFIGPVEENLKDLKQGYRYLVESNYKIIYFVTDDCIYITDIFDCRQNPTKKVK